MRSTSQLQPIDEVRKCSDLGDHYMSNQQWNNAVTMYERALVTLEAILEPGAPLPSITPAHLERLAGLRGVSFDVQGLAAPGDDHDARQALAQIRSAQMTLEADLGDARVWKNIGLLRSPSGNSWFFSLYQSKDLTCGSTTITVPAGLSITWCCRILGDRVTCTRLTGARARQLSFLLAHLASARVTATMKLYYQAQILISSGIPAIMAQAHLYEHALQIHPENAWALAHFGEVFRDIANGWPGSVDHLSTPGARAADYTRAILYYQESLRIQPDSFWAHAHLGAAIVNVRGFAGFSGPGAPIHMPDLLALHERYFPDAAQPGHPPAAKDKELLDKGKEHLETAQRLLGQYYPWAEAYYAYTLMLLGALDEDDPDNARNVGVLSTVYLTDAFYLQSTLLSQALEPGELYVNGFFQMGIFSLWLRDYSTAWYYARLGMQRLFKFHFLVGLESLLGCQLLANIAALRLGDPAASSRETRAPGPLLSDAPLGVMSPQIAVPPAPFADSAALVAFLTQTFDVGCKGVTATWLDHAFPLSTSITVGLLQVVFVLDNFSVILQDLGLAGDSAVSALSGSMEELKTTILGRLSMTMPRPPSQSFEIKDAYHHHLGNLFSQFNSAKPTYSLASALAPVPGPR